jgi:hypothetical protein
MTLWIALKHVLPPTPKKKNYLNNDLKNYLEKDERRQNDILRIYRQFDMLPKHFQS